MSGLLARLSARTKGRTLAGGATLQGDPVADLTGARVAATGPKGEAFSARFLDTGSLSSEARADLARRAAFKNPSVPLVAATGEEEGDPYFIEYAQGGIHLDQILARARKEGQGAPAFFILDPEEARGRTGNIPREPYWRATCRIGIDVGKCLLEYRKAGLVPTQLKPEWIWLRSDGNPMLRYLGLLGPPVADPCQEVLAVGRLLHAMATLEAFDQDKLTAPRLVEPKINEAMETILLAATAPSPAARYAHVGDLVQDLDLYMTHRPITAKRPGFFGRMFGAGPRAR
jgi:hypothetical protein